MKAICIVGENFACYNAIFIGRNLDMVETYQSLKLKSDQNTFAWRAREINLNRQLENKENEVIGLKIDHEDDRF